MRIRSILLGALVLLLSFSVAQMAGEASSPIRRWVASTIRYDEPTFDQIDVPAPAPAPVSDPAPAPEPTAPAPEPTPHPVPAKEPVTPPAPVPDTHETPAPPAKPPAGGTTPADGQPQPKDPTPAPPANGNPAKPIFHLPTTAREVAITFDDGPSVYTKSMAAILKQQQVPATFFWIAGNNGLDLSVDLIAQGHQIGTHTVSHPKLTTLDAAAQLDQLSRSQKLLQEASKGKIHLFRPPYGSYNDATLKHAGALGLSVVLWDVDSRDWALADHPEQIVPGVMKQVKPGSIILMHERAQTLKVLPDLIKALRDAGYTFTQLP